MYHLQQSIGRKVRSVPKVMGCFEVTDVKVRLIERCGCCKLWSGNLCERRKEDPIKDDYEAVEGESCSNRNSQMRDRDRWQWLSQQLFNKTHNFEDSGEDLSPRYDRILI